MAVPSTVLAPASLYVGDLHPDITDSQLFDAFSIVDNLTSVRVCRDSTSGKSLCYGYANYISAKDANLAIEKLNHTLLNGKPIRVMWSNRDPDARKSGIGNLFVKNLNDSIDNVKLHEMFSKFGNIASCKLEMSPDGKSKGYGFVQFESEASANAAVEKLNGSIIDDKKLYVGNFVRKTERLASLDAKYTNLYVKNLDLDVTEEFLREKFSGFGKITNLIISKDNDGNSRGFGFVNFLKPDDAKQAMEALNGTRLGSKALYVAWAQKKSERQNMLHHLFDERRKENIQKYKGSNVYVKNIADTVDEFDLREQFSQFGTITSTKLMRDDKGISKGFGFVCFSTPEEATKAVSSLHGFIFHQKPLYVAIAQKKEDRRAQLEFQYAHMMGLVGPSTAVTPAGYSHLYYEPPLGVVSQFPTRQGLRYQPQTLGAEWRANGYASPAGMDFQPMSLPAISNTPRQQRQNRSRMNGHMLPQQAGQAKYVPNGHAPYEIKNGSGVFSASVNPQHQKQILGEQLYPIIFKQRRDQAAKITGMLLEMDNREIQQLLRSPQTLTAKVEEAVRVLKVSKTKAAEQGARHPQ